MVTFRSNNYYGNVDVRLVDGFTSVVNYIVQTLSDTDCLRPNAIQKYNIEYSLYDTNINHDTLWIEGKNK